MMTVVSEESISPVTYSIIVPAYNEQDRIGSTLDHILEFVHFKRWSSEIVVVNDGSSDGTAALVASYASRAEEIRLINNPGNRGKGYAVKNGIMHAKGEFVFITDADLSTPFTEAEKLMRELWSGAEVAIGSRWLSARMQTIRQPLHRQLVGRLFNLLTRLVLGLNFFDTQCGFKAFRTSAAKRIFSRQRIERWGFDPEVLAIARLFAFKAVEVPVKWANDNRSKVNPLADGLRMLMELLTIRWNLVRGVYCEPDQSTAHPERALPTLSPRQAFNKDYPRGTVAPGA